MQHFFIKVAYENQNTKVLHFQLPLGLLCLQTELCHIFLTLIPYFSIPRIVMMYAPLGLVSEFCSFIPLLYVQACYMHNILHDSYSFYCNQQLCDQTYCRQKSIPQSTWNMMIFLCDCLEPFYFCISLQHVQNYDI